MCLSLVRAMPTYLALLSVLVLLSSPVHALDPFGRGHFWSASAEAKGEDYLGTTPQLIALLPPPDEIARPVYNNARLDALKKEWVRIIEPPDSRRSCIRQINTAPDIFGRSLFARYRFLGDYEVTIELCPVPSWLFDARLAEMEKRFGKGKAQPAGKGAVADDKAFVFSRFGALAQRGQAVVQIVSPRTNGYRGMNAEPLQAITDGILERLAGSPFGKRIIDMPTHETLQTMLITATDAGSASGIANATDQKVGGMFTRSGAFAATTDGSPISVSVRCIARFALQLQQDGKRGNVETQLAACRTPKTTMETFLKEKGAQLQAGTGSATRYEEDDVDVGNGGHRITCTRTMKLKGKEKTVWSTSTVVFQRGIFVGIVQAEISNEEPHARDVALALAKRAVERIEAKAKPHQLGGSKQEESAPVPDEIIFGMDVTAPACVPAEGYVKVEKMDPRSLIVAGTVRDKKGRPVEGAEIALSDFQDVKAISSPNGTYKLQLDFMYGKGTATCKRDFVLDRIPGRLVVTFEKPDGEPNEPLTAVADGQLVDVLLKAEADGEPYAGRNLQIILPEDFRIDGRPVWYVLDPHPTPGDAMCRTDAKGEARIRLGTPRTSTTLQLEVEPEVRKFQDELFPIVGQIVVRDVATEATAGVPVDYGCPFPRVTRLTMPAVEAGKLQGLRSTLEWRDLTDSKQWDVKMIMPGKIHIPVASGNVYDPERNVPHTERLDQHVRAHVLLKAAKLEFSFEPAARGDDFTDIPDYWAKVGQAVGDTLLDFAVGKLGDKLLNRVPNMKAAAAADGRLAAASTKRAKYLTKVAETSLDVAQKAPASAANTKAILGQARKQITAARAAKGRQVLREALLKERTRYTTDGVKNVLTMGLEAGKAAGATAQQIDDGQVSHTENINSAIGMVDGLQNFVHDSSVLDQASNRMLVLKLAWAWAKTTKECYNDYCAVANGWRDCVLLPVQVLITNEQGYTAIARRSVPVHFDKKSTTKGEALPLMGRKGDAE